MRLGRGVEQHDVGVSTDLEGTLGSETEAPRGGRGHEVDHPLEGDPPLRDALTVEDRQERLDARGSVADLVEGHAVRRLGLLGVQPVGDMVGRDEIERAVGQARPQRLAVSRGSQRRRDEEPGAGDGIGVVVALLGQDQVMRACLGGDADASRLCAADLLEGGRRGKVHDVDRRVGHPRERQRPRRRHRLDVAWSRAGVVAR